MKHLKKFLVLALAGLMMLSACASTGSDSGTDAGTGTRTESGSGSDTNTGTTAAAPADNGDSRPMLGNMYLEGLPIVNERESFSYLIDDSSDLSRLEEWPIIRMMEDESNVHVEWMIFPHEVAMERKNILINTGEYPDVIGGWLISRADVVRYGASEGIFIPLETLFEEHAPNIMEAINNPGVRAEMTLTNGHIYSPPYPVDSPLASNGPWIYQPWLDALGLQMPKTTGELTEVLRAFRDKDPNGNGRPQDVIPFGVRGDQIGWAMAFFGYPVIEGDGDMFVMVNGRPTFTANMDFYKDAIKFFAGWYAEGIMDPELFTQDIDMMRGKGRTELPTYGAIVSYFPGDVSPGPDENDLPIRMAEYVPIPPLTNPQGSTPNWRRGSYGSYIFTNQVVVTDNAVNPATIVRWFDYLYSPEISIQYSWGVLGIELENVSPGVYTHMDESLLEADLFRHIGAMPRFVRPGVELLRTPGDQLGFESTQNMDRVWVNNLTEMVPGLWLDADTAAEIATIRTDIRNYIVQKRAEWISGVADVDTEWDAYVEQLDRLGLPKLTDVILTALGY